MRLNTFIGTGVIALALTLSACGADEDKAATSDMMTPSATADMSMAPQADLTGTFAGLNDKTVAGTVTISGDTVTLAGFSSDEGPDLHLYLTTGTDEAAVAAGTELGGVDFDEASQTFTLPAGTMVSDFTDLVVHCDKAKAVFGAAELS